MSLHRQLYTPELPLTEDSQSSVAALTLVEAGARTFA